MASVPKRKRPYTAQDLWPPGSQGNVDFPPAAFYPVYLGNFLCSQFNQLVPRVQQYFASKGLLARMVFVRDAANDPFRAYQDMSNLYDCLVYFTRPEDAEDAVRCLHREKYFGHRLNLFPGRVPIRVLLERSVGYIIPDMMSAWPDHIIAEHIEKQTRANVETTKRLSVTRIIVQYVSRTHQIKALERYRHCIPNSLAGQVIYKQGFIEENVMMEIKHQIANTPFMVMGPERHVLDALCTDNTPDVPMDWAWDRVPGLKHFLKQYRQPDHTTQLKIAQTTLKTFGVKCFFVRKLPKDVQKQKSVKTFKRDAYLRLRMYRKQYRKSMSESYRDLNVQLPWQEAIGH